MLVEIEEWESSVNSDPYRGASQPADRRVINRSGASPYRPADEPQPFKDDTPQQSAPRPSGARRDSAAKEPGSKKGLFWTLLIVAVVAALAVVGWVLWSNARNATTGIDPSKYQAVFLDNGQIYFGKLSSFNDESMKITKIYYPQAQANAEEGEEAAVSDTPSNIQLLRVTEGVHGPEDEMIIMKSRILYYENLRSDSQVAELIDRNGN